MDISGVFDAVLLGGLVPYKTVKKNRHSYKEL